MEVYMQMKDIGLEGNLIDNGWIEHLKYESGVTNLNAVMILSEIVYWYRPVEIRDEYSGDVKGYRKKFRADKLQKSYDALAKRFGLTKRQVKDACDFLVKRGIITIEFRHVKTEAGTIPNVMFVEPVMENLKNITGINRVVNDTGTPTVHNRCNTSEGATPQANEPYPPFKRNIPSDKTEDTPRLNATYPPIKRNTYTTKTTTETIPKITCTTEIINTQEHSQSVCLSSQSTGEDIKALCQTGVSQPQPASTPHQTQSQPVSPVPGNTTKTACQTAYAPPARARSQHQASAPIGEITLKELERVFQNAQTCLFDARLFIEHVIKMLYTDGHMPYMLQMGLTHTDVQDRLRLLTHVHIDVALKKMVNCRFNKELYFAKCLLTAIVEVHVDNLVFEMQQDDSSAEAPKEPQRKHYNSGKIPQRDNFDQREPYTDEEYERIYANLEDVDVDTPCEPAPKPVLPKKSSEDGSYEQFLAFEEKQKKYAEYVAWQKEPRVTPEEKRAIYAEAEAWLKQIATKTQEAREAAKAMTVTDEAI